MKKDKKVYNHKFFDKHTILGSIVLMLIGFLGVQILTIPISLVLNNVFDNKTVSAGISAVIIILLILLIYERRFYPFEGSLRGGDFQTGLRLALFSVASWVLIIPTDFLFGDAVLGAPTFANACLAMQAGFTEEIIFRALPASYLMRQWRDEKKIPVIVIFTSLIFGLIHLMNVISGAPLEETMIQVLVATTTGMFFCALYLRSGNIWFTIALHTIYDALCFLDVHGIKDGVAQATEFDWTNGLEIVVDIALAVVALWLIRPAKRGEIRRLWDQKWHLQENA